jgi:hypothetical protein
MDPQHAQLAAVQAAVASMEQESALEAKRQTARVSRAMRATETAVVISKTSRTPPPAAVTCRQLLRLLRTTARRLCWALQRRAARTWVV